MLIQSIITFSPVKGFPHYGVEMPVILKREYKKAQKSIKPAMYKNAKC